VELPALGLVLDVLGGRLEPMLLPDEDAMLSDELDVDDVRLLAFDLLMAVTAVHWLSFVSLELSLVRDAAAALSAGCAPEAESALGALRLGSEGLLLDIELDELACARQVTSTTSPLAMSLRLLTALPVTGRDRLSWLAMAALAELALRSVMVLASRSTETTSAVSLASFLDLLLSFCVSVLDMSLGWVLLPGF
jgi:hypothetical protein